MDAFTFGAIIGSIISGVIVGLVPAIKRCCKEKAWIGNRRLFCLYRCFNFIGIDFIYTNLSCIYILYFQKVKEKTIKLHRSYDGPKHHSFL